MTDQRIRIEVPANEWITSNDRLHWREKARRVAAVRRRSAVLARQHLTPIDGPVLVACRARFRAGRGLDSDGCAPTLKAAIDGMTDAGIWPDDDGRNVSAICYLRSRRDTSLGKGWHALDIIITSQLVPF
ncbi:hypothetical protein DUY81_13940 [Acidipropionibacterium acidipropionici]|uniref:Uncharacterized protein n=1 Tax=Acidipropionibacterium acidipropionici TaxID=1748 RepID=A0AAC8YHC8_9ACTN|nr:hypothetical protein [Acidipropionibacterium acidipropionici]AMS06469.1 hypothetical protein AXH35_14425 [Acidipropionibacterium acidipropionici]AOZ47916.1 hypothetical protein A8L58_15880 [Acidipropionibacterium acidipropionici]AZP38738.1 hypothetical protein DUY81_13940 [Acidipropionibacterium acidipropionici]